MSRQQPGWGAPTTTYPPALQPRKSSTGRFLGIGCFGIVALVILIVLASAVMGGGESGNSGSDKQAASGNTEDKAKDEPKDAAKATPEADKGGAEKVVFKVWGTAPAGVDINYGSDSDSIQGEGLPMTKSMKLKDDALWYHINAQLQGGGDIHCSVTVDGKTKKGHASGGYNICNTQLSGDPLGGWN